MEVEKKRSKGGFLNLFDWSGKSRKKLFTNNSELPDGSRNGKENVDNRAKLLLQMVETDESRASSSNRDGSDFNCASSVTSDDGYATRAPGVVARLMGLDSMPTSNGSEQCSTPYFDLCSHRALHLNRPNPNLWSEYQPVDSMNFPNKVVKLPWNSESRLTKVSIRPIDRFQSEVLPPRSAKPISITHHKLLSPIKSPGFFPARNATYIMEAAAKIIEASPQPTVKNKAPSIATSPAPLRIRDLKERMEAAHKVSRSLRSNEPGPAKHMRGQWSEKNLNRADGRQASKVSTNIDKGSPERLRNKGKLVSMAVQGKVNVQRREGSTSSSNISSKKQKVKNDAKVNPLHQGQPDVQRHAHKGTSSNRSNNVLWSNNQKQNHVPNKDKNHFPSKDSSISGTSVSNQQNKNVKPVNGSTEPTRSVKKVVVHSETISRKNGLLTDTERKLSSSRRKDGTQNKQHVGRNLQFGESATNNMYNKKDNKSVKSNVAANGPVNWDAENRKKGMDIVSFTFTSPIKRSVADPQPSNCISGRIKSFSLDSHANDDQSSSTNSLFPSPGMGAMGSDSLSILLEQKLKELTCKLESSHCNIVREGSSTRFAAALQDLVSLGTDPAEVNKRSSVDIDEDMAETLREIDCSSIDDPGLVVKHSEGLEEHSNSSNSETGIEYDCRHPSPVSILEPSFMTGSCSDVKTSASCKKQYLSEAEVYDWFPTTSIDSTTGECETELSDSASSISFGSRYTTKMPGLVDSEDSSIWEFNNVKRIIVNAELMFEEFTLGQTDTVISLTLFDLENQEHSEEVNEENSKLELKLLFDCVCECLDSKCKQFSVGSRKAWARSGTFFQRRGRLAEEVYREIVGWRSMGDLMVDELVDKDMSSQIGKWVDFDSEAFEEGAVIENDILTSLVDELISDLI